MQFNLILISILLPIAFGALIFWGDFEKKMREILCMAVICASSAIVIYLVITKPIFPFTFFKLSSAISMTFKVDGLSRIFGLLLAVLWPIATLWAFENMDYEERQDKFFGLYTAGYGISLGVCFASNLLTMFFFYELLAAISLAIISSSKNESSKAKGTKFAIYSVIGAVLSLAGIILYYSLYGKFDFSLTGLHLGVELPNPLYYVAFILMFFGFGVKAAILPFYAWLPSLNVDRTSTALIDVIAVVNAACFAIIRVSYCSIGAKILRGTWAQGVALLVVAITIIFGSIMAYKEKHFRKRLAYSTVTNLSNILFGALLTTQWGLLGACLFMLYHGIIMLCLFLVAGTCYDNASVEYIDGVKGLGRKMPITFACFTIASLALIGVPPLCGFFSKYVIGIASVAWASVSWVGYVGIAAVLVSTFLTAVYLLSIVIKAYFTEKEFDWTLVGPVKDPAWKMLVPFIILAVLCIILGFMSPGITNFITESIEALF